MNAPASSPCKAVTREIWRESPTSFPACNHELIRWKGFTIHEAGAALLRTCVARLANLESTPIGEYEQCHALTLMAVTRGDGNLGSRPNFGRRPATSTRANGV